jgi:hypothetical protein
VTRRARDQARSLELVIRAAEAEQRLYARRLDQVAKAQQRTRADIERELRREHFGQLPDGWDHRNGDG